MENGTVVFKRTNIPLMVLLSSVSMGVYVPYWFLSRRKNFEALKHNLNFMALKALFGLYILSLVFNLVHTSIFTELGINVFNSLDLIVTFFGLGIMYYSVFRARDSIEDELNEQVYKPWLLILFHIWYLQYKLNQMESKNETYLK